MTCWEILGLSFKATVEEVKRAYREKAGTAHPDVGGSAQEFTRLHLAYKEALEEAEKPMICPQCGGLGRVRHMVNWSSVYLNCPECAGNGTVLR